jgi:methylene-fatty-acyl-phospholipid synthase
MGGNKYRACWLIGAYVFCFSKLRDLWYDDDVTTTAATTNKTHNAHIPTHTTHDTFKSFKLMLEDQPATDFLSNDVVTALGYAVFAVGQVLVLSSMWRLGFYGTFLGDYAGILMKARVTAFPYNVVENPMYVGGFLGFLGAALMYGKLSGVLIALLAHLVYRVAEQFEGPFTSFIYAQAAEAAAAQSERDAAQSKLQAQQDADAIKLKEAATAAAVADANAAVRPPTLTKKND